MLHSNHSHRQFISLNTLRVNYFLLQVTLSSFFLVDELSEYVPSVHCRFYTDIHTLSHQNVLTNVSFQITYYAKCLLTDRTDVFLTVSRIDQLVFT